jgi:hypothetical protein
MLPLIAAVPTHCLDIVILTLTRSTNNFLKVMTERFLRITQHTINSILDMLAKRMCMLDGVLASGLARDNWQPKSAERATTEPPSHLVAMPLELFYMVSDRFSFQDLKALRETSNELGKRCRDKFYADANTSMVRLELDDVLALAQFKIWSDKITSVRLEVPRNAFFYQYKPPHWCGEHDQHDMKTTTDNFPAMAAKQEFKIALEVLTRLPRCHTTEVEHGIGLHSTGLDDFETSRKAVVEKLRATFKTVLGHNLHEGLVGFLHRENQVGSNPYMRRDKYQLDQYSLDKKFVIS